MNGCYSYNREWIHSGQSWSHPHSIGLESAVSECFSGSMRVVAVWLHPQTSKGSVKPDEIRWESHWQSAADRIDIMYSYMILQLMDAQNKSLILVVMVTCLHRIVWQSVCHSRQDRYAYIHHGTPEVHDTTVTGCPYCKSFKNMKNMLLPADGWTSRTVLWTCCYRYLYEYDAGLFCRNNMYEYLHKADGWTMHGTKCRRMNFVTIRRNTTLSSSGFEFSRILRRSLHRGMHYPVSFLCEEKSSNSIPFIERRHGTRHSHSHNAGGLIDHLFSSALLEVPSFAMISFGGRPQIYLSTILWYESCTSVSTCFLPSKWGGME